MAFDKKEQLSLIPLTFLRFSKTLLKQEMRRVDNFPLKLISNNNLTSNPRGLQYKMFI